MSAPSGCRDGENALLFAAARCAPGVSEDAPRGAALDWGYLLDAANLHGISPLLFAAHEHGLAAPERAADALRAAYWVGHFRNRTLLEELRAVLRAAASSGIAVMPLKGALLAPLYYPTPALRPMSDLDLLVHDADIAAFAALLACCGYAAPDTPRVAMDGKDRDPFFREYSFVKQIGDTPLLIEYRAEPLDPGVMAFPSLDPALAARLREHVERMWARSGIGALDGVPFARLSPEDLLLHVAVHLTTRHANFRLLWLHDMCRIAARHAGAMDWSYLASAAHDLRLGAPVFAALEAAHDRLGAPIPLVDLRPLFFTRGWNMPRAAETIEYRLLARQQRAMGRADLTARPGLPLWLGLVALLRLRGARVFVGVLRRVIAPSRAYMRVWSEDTAHRDLAYRPALLLRGLLTLIRVSVIASGHLAPPKMSDAIRRSAVRIAARLGLALFPQSGA